ncbi:hypothetical protein F5Y15DRAFT_429926 [Xylariaceae sp. FL0016]|nr:hypothetical protein F5Y15DRAFT_429926 [Xylariaceae sp. FL0016]
MRYQAHSYQNNLDHLSSINMTPIPRKPSIHAHWLDNVTSDLSGRIHILSDHGCEVIAEHPDVALADYLYEHIPHPQHKLENKPHVFHGHLVINHKHARLETYVGDNAKIEAGTSTKPKKLSKSYKLGDSNKGKCPVRSLSIIGKHTEGDAPAAALPPLPKRPSFLRMRSGPAALQQLPALNTTLEDAKSTTALQIVNKSPKSPQARGRCPCGFSMRQDDDKPLTLNAHSATITRALTLGPSPRTLTTVTLLLLISKIALKLPLPRRWISLQAAMSWHMWGSRVDEDHDPDIREDDGQRDDC